MVLPVGQSALAAQQAFHAAHDAAVHAVVQLTKSVLSIVSLMMDKTRLY